MREPKGRVSKKDQSADEEVEIQVEDPLALFRDHHFAGPPGSHFERFRRLALRSRQLVFSVLLLSIVGSFVMMIRTRQPESAEELVQRYFARFAGANDSFVYAIGEYRVDEAHLKQLFPALLSFTWGAKGSEEALMDSEIYGGFLRDQFETDILVNAAIKEGRLNTPEARLVIENSVRHAVADYYLYSRLATPESNFRVDVPREQVLAMYEKNHDFYSRQGLDKPASLAVIERSIAEVRRNELNLALVRARQEVLSDLKDRAGYLFKGPGSRRQ